MFALRQRSAHLKEPLRQRCDLVPVAPTGLHASQLCSANETRRPSVDSFGSATHVLQHRAVQRELLVGATVGSLVVPDPMFDVDSAVPTLGESIFMELRPQATCRSHCYLRSGHEILPECGLWRPGARQAAVQSQTLIDPPTPSSTTRPIGSPCRPGGGPKAGCSCTHTSSTRPASWGVVDLLVTRWRGRLILERWLPPASELRATVRP